MKKRILSIFIAGAMTLSAALGLSACNLKESTGGNAVNDVYALSAVSGVSYLAEDVNMGAVTPTYPSLSEQPDAPAPESAPEIAPEVNPEPSPEAPSVPKNGIVSGIKNSLAMLEEILSGTEIKQEIKKNTSNDPRFAGYSYEMSIAAPSEAGGFKTYIMYFNETAEIVRSEIDDGIKESEIITKFEGLTVFNDEMFLVYGTQTLETEGLEKESSVLFKTYRATEDGKIADDLNYVIVEYSEEQGEAEYKYTFISDGIKLREIEFEYEKEGLKKEISFGIKEYGENGRAETEYTVVQGFNGGFMVEVEIDEREYRFSAEKLEDGSYKFNYDKSISWIFD